VRFAALPRRGPARADRLAWLAALVLLLALALAGRRYHWVEEAGTAERDGYVAQGEQLRAGSLPHDPYRPLLYPLLIAAVTPLTGDAFAAARLLSNVAAAALAWLAWACGRRLAGAAAGAWAMALAAVNPNLWIIGQHATTDMLFAALGAACLLAALRYLQQPAWLSALLCGAALGLAIFTRANAIVLLPALLVAWWLAPAAPAGAAVRPDAEPPGAAIDRDASPLDAAIDRDAAPLDAAIDRDAAPLDAALGSAAGGGRRAGRWRHLVLALAAAIVVLVPHWALRYAAFGNPLHDENWKNLAFKLYGYPDWSYLDRVPFHSLAEIVRHDPAAVLRGGIAELERFAAAGAAQLFGTAAHVILIAAGALWALWNRATRRSASWLLFALASFLGVTALVFFTWGRLLLVLLPGSYALAFAPWSHARPRAGRVLRGALSAVAAALVLVLAVKTFVFRLPAFAARHPYVEVELLRGLDARLPAAAVLGGSSPFLGRYLRHRYLALPDAFGDEIVRPALYYARLERQVRQAGIGWLVIGPVDLRSRPAGLLGPAAPVPWLAPAGGDRGVIVWKVIDSSAR
jgi:hypothetical protein